MKLGVVFGYWGAGPRPGFVEEAQAAERLGYDSVWVAESWGNDAFTYAAYVAANTSTIKIGTGIVQMAARTPTATTMAAVTLDHLSNGRLILGLGVSGPQVVEGWYGQPSNRPLARTREYVDVIRRALRREGPLENDGEFYPLPYRGEGSQGLGKPLKIMTHPLRADIPIFLGAEGPKNVALAGEICDGWLALFFSPHSQGFYRDALAEGFARDGAQHDFDSFEIAATVPLIVHDDVEAAADMLRPYYALYFGGMGAKGANFHNDVPRRMGFEAEAEKVQDLYLEGRKDEAAAALPTRLIEQLSLIGPADKIRDDLAAWRESIATTLLISGDAAAVRQAAELVLG